jgi:hypothetical protein
MIPQAFPESQSCYGGMTLRDYFAAQALVAISGVWKGTISDLDKAAFDRTAFAAYSLADAMLAARSVTSPIGKSQP